MLIKDKLLETIKVMIPNINQTTSVKIGITDIPIFMKHTTKIDQIFNESIIVHIVENKENINFEICEYDNFGSKKRTLIILSDRYNKEHGYFKQDNSYIKKDLIEKKSIQKIINIIKNNKFNLNDFIKEIEIIKLLRDHSIILLDNFYDEHTTINGIKTTLRDLNLVKSMHVDELILNLNHVFIVNKISTGITGVSFNVTNIKLD